MSDDDDFDWASLGDEPLLAELDDDALLEAVLDRARDAPPPLAAAPPRWVRPAVTALVVLAASIALFLFAPAWTRALLGDDETGTTAPDVERRESSASAAEVHAERTKPRPRAEPTPPRSREQPKPPPMPETLSQPEPRTQPTQRTRTKPPSADELLRQAQDALVAKNAARAIRAYAALARVHPRSPQARTAHVSLGRLHLAKGRAHRALRHYDAYLEAAGGNLRREAELGRIDALRELERRAAERSAIEAFLRDHPGTMHASRLRSRLEALQ